MNSTHMLFSVPDWQDPSQYEIPDKEPFCWDRWAWEFLRRNAKFQDEVNQCIAECLPMNAKPVRWRDHPVSQVFLAWGVDYSVWGHECWGLVHEIDDPEKRPSLTIDRSRFPPFLFCKWPRFPFSSQEQSDDKTSSLVFLLTEPLGPQLERAKRLLELERDVRVEACGLHIRKRNNEQKSMFSTYLRVLDARSESVSRYDLAEALSSDTDNVSNWIKSAEELRDEGYRRLLEKK
jgi:hypothetical protein